MRLTRKLVLLALGAASAVVARTGHAQLTIPLCPVDGTLQVLIDFGTTGCLIDDKVFYNFHSHIVSGGGTPTTEADIHYDLYNPNPLRQGFIFTSTWFAPAGVTFDQSLRYTVRTIDGGQLMSDAHLSEAGDFALPGPAGEPGTGFIQIAEDICVGDLFFNGCNAPSFVLSINTSFGTGTPGVHNDQANWGPPYASLIDVVKDIRVNGGNGGAGFSVMDQYVTQTPEPATLALMGGGLVLLGLAGRARRRLD